MLPGAAFAYALSAQISIEAALRLAVGIVATCLVASANYTINEFLDAEFDRLHPLKRHRPGAQGLLIPWVVFAQYVCLAAGGLAAACCINSYFLAAEVALLIMGLVYNVNPIRTKDRVYLDVLSESVNNPIRFLLGWFCIVSSSFPPSSILISYWSGGAFLMGMKRYAEYREIGDPEVAGAYRRSFLFYTERRLLVSSFFYALNSVFFLGIFLVKYRIEYILLFPLVSLLFVEYLLIAMKDHASAYAPEKLHRQTRLMVILAVIVCLLVGLFLVRIPGLDFLLQRVVISRSHP